MKSLWRGAPTPGPGVPCQSWEAFSRHAQAFCPGMVESGRCVGWGFGMQGKDLSECGRLFRLPGKSMPLLGMALPCMGKRHPDAGKSATGMRMRHARCLHGADCFRGGLERQAGHCSGPASGGMRIHARDQTANAMLRNNSRIIFTLLMLPYSRADVNIRGGNTIYGMIEKVSHPHLDF